jgi:hypothetical protein
MKLASTTRSHFQELMSWFPDRRSCEVWASPAFPYPFTETTFLEHLRPEVPSFSLIGDDQELLGFGQATYPEEILPDCVYMVAALKELLQTAT